MGTRKSRDQIIIATKYSQADHKAVDTSFKRTCQLPDIDLTPDHITQIEAVKAWQPGMPHAIIRDCINNNILVVINAHVDRLPPRGIVSPRGVKCEWRSGESLLGSFSMRNAESNTSRENMYLDGIS
jgi:hypothetical protein